MIVTNVVPDDVLSSSLDVTHDDSAIVVTAVTTEQDKAIGSQLVDRTPVPEKFLDEPVRDILSLLEPCCSEPWPFRPETQGSAQGLSVDHEVSLGNSAGNGLLWNRVRKLEGPDDECVDHDPVA